MSLPRTRMFWCRNSPSQLTQSIYKRGKRQANWSQVAQWNWMERRSVLIDFGVENNKLMSSVKFSSRFCCFLRQTRQPDLPDIAVNAVTVREIMQLQINFRSYLICFLLWNSFDRIRVGRMLLSSIHLHNGNQYDAIYAAGIVRAIDVAVS